jgi:sodium/hydrogen exchanger 3
MSFNQEFFFLVILPPILFESGYNLHRGPFFHNLDSILATSLLGTTISTLLTGALIFSAAKAGLTSYGLTLNDCFLYGALISATDTVSILALFKAVGVDARVYANIFGESSLNDGVAFVLYKTIIGFQTAEVTGLSIFVAVLKVIYIFFGSIIVAVVVGLLNAILFKYTSLYKMPIIETLVLIIYTYFSYYIAEGLHLSGIIAIFICGITMGHYSFQNLSSASQRASKKFFEILAKMAETFVFIYLGMAIFLFDTKFDVGLIMWSIPILLLARAANIFPLVGIANLRREKNNRVPFNHQVMMWFSGIRGAMAFSLTVDVPSHSKTIIQTTTLIIVFITVIVFGGLTVPVLKFLRIKIGKEAEEEEMELPTKGGATEMNNAFLAFDREDLIPFFTRHLRKKNQVSVNGGNNFRADLQLLPRTSSEVDNVEFFELDGYVSDASVQLA